MVKKTKRRISKTKRRSLKNKKVGGGSWSWVAHMDNYPNKITVKYTSWDLGRENIYKKYWKSGVDINVGNILVNTVKAGRWLTEQRLFATHNISMFPDSGFSVVEGIMINTRGAVTGLILRPIYYIKKDSDTEYITLNKNLLSKTTEPNVTDKFKTESDGSDIINKFIQEMQTQNLQSNPANTCDKKNITACNIGFKNNDTLQPIKWQSYLEKYNVVVNDASLNVFSPSQRTSLKLYSLFVALTCSRTDINELKKNPSKYLSRDQQQTLDENFPNFLTKIPELSHPPAAAQAQLLSKSKAVPSASGHSDSHDDEEEDDEAEDGDARVKRSRTTKIPAAATKAKDPHEDEHQHTLDIQEAVRNQRTSLTIQSQHQRQRANNQNQSHHDESVHRSNSAGPRQRASEPDHAPDYEPEPPSDPYASDTDDWEHIYSKSNSRWYWRYKHDHKKFKWIERGYSPQL